MAQLLVRKLDESLITELRRRAARSGRSVEEEHRLILREALTGISTTTQAKSLEEYLIADPCEPLDFELPRRDYPKSTQAI